ncbi:MAG: hypothetical protein QF886_25625, partial [Planctomycetota bacterium]|nr:hypothetical protein [Planctomycetota bacterium]
EGFYQKAPNLKEGYPPGMVRTIMTGDPYGFVTAANLKLGPLFWNERIAAMLVNGAEPRFHDYRHWRVGYAAHANPAACIWDAWDWIGRYTGAEWKGWWENGKLLQIESGGKMVLGSFYLRRREKMLLVITNYEQTPEDELRLRLALKELGFEGRIHAEDAVTSQPLAISERGEMKIDIFGQRYRLIKISKELPRFRREALSETLLMNPPKLLNQTWYSPYLDVDENSLHVLQAEVKIERPIGETSKNPNVMGRFSPHIKHYVGIALESTSGMITGVNGTTRRSGDQPFDQTPHYLRTYRPQWWKPTAGWSTMFLPVRVGEKPKNCRFRVYLTDKGEAQIRGLSLRRVLK